MESLATIFFIIMALIGSTEQASCDFDHPESFDPYCANNQGFTFVTNNNSPPSNFWAAIYVSIADGSGPQLPHIHNSNIHSLMFNPQGGTATGFQTAFVSPVIPVPVLTEVGCVTFYYNMYSQVPAAMGSLYLVVDYSGLASAELKTIDEANLVSTADRVEHLIASGGQGEDWLPKSVGVDISGRTSFRVYFQVIRGGEESAIALDEIVIQAAQGTCSGVDISSNPTASPPQTTAPPTTAPPTTAPPTTVPPTTAPPTTAPPTTVPPTTAPPTTAPPTTAPPTTVPPTTAPPTTAPPIGDIGQWLIPVFYNNCSLGIPCGATYGERKYCTANQVCPCPSPLLGPCECHAGAKCDAHPNHGTIYYVKEILCEGHSPCVEPITEPAITTVPPTTEPATTTAEKPISNDTVAGWSSWLGFTECSVTCGWGTRQKSRYCNNPYPRPSEISCLKVDKTRGIEEIVPEDCYGGKECEAATDGGWSAWEVSVECSVTCGGGLETVRRNCSFPPPIGGGLNCLTETSTRYAIEEKSQPCNGFSCPDPLISLSSWGDWSSCSGTCGYGVMIRTRNCAPIGFCNGLSSETRECSTGCRLYTCPSTSSYSYQCNFESTCFQDFVSIDYFNNVGQFTPSMNTGPTSDNTYPTGCGNFIYFNSMTGSMDKSYLSSPGLVAPTGQQCISFFVNMFSVNSIDMGTLTVYFLQTQSDSMYQELVWKSSPELTTTPSSWYKVNIDLNNLDNRNKYFIVFEVNNMGSAKSDMAIDDYTVSTGLCEGKVDGYWSEWSNWGGCSESCGNGTSNRQRACDFPSPRNGGMPCVGDSLESKSCTLVPCPQNGNWSEWSMWRECSKSCDNGTRSRERFCNNPAPAISGDLCKMLNGTDGHEEHQRELCEMEACDLDGGWGQWSDFATCTVTCGTGTESRSRRCDNPWPRGKGLFCQLVNGGSYIAGLIEADTRPCANIGPCPINGVWGQWTNYNACNTTCGNGTRDRSRSCNTPSPMYGGDACASSHGLNTSMIEYDYEFCTNPCCPENGTWVEWEYEACSVTCETGTRRMKLNCTTATCGGIQECNAGTNATRAPEPCSERATCNELGGWSDWMNSECSTTCGYGDRLRFRLCNNPHPFGNGIGCETVDGRTVMSENITENCFVDCNRNGSWSDWVNTTCSPCNSTEGLLNQTRYCNSPTALGNGTNCTDTYGNEAITEYKYNIPCMEPCGKPGNWSSWINNTACNQTCDGGYWTVERTCTNPLPIGNGANCTDTNGNPSIYESIWQLCNEFSCPTQGLWAQWTEFTTCVGSCGDINRTRTRNCTQPAPMFGGSACLHSDNVTISLYEVDSKSCDYSPCPVIPSWTEWTEWSDCSVGCKPGGIRIRTQNCTTDGQPCIHPYKPSLYIFHFNTTEVCNENLNCTVHGNWSEWGIVNGTCDVECGNGTQQEFRNCTNPEPFDGGDLCIDKNGQPSRKEYRNITCVLTECVINGTWALWSDWSNCSVNCGAGKTNRSRECTDPRPSGGGLPCLRNDSTLGLSEDVKVDCFIDHCPDDDDCSFDTDFCGFVFKNDPTRWLREPDATHTLNTGPSAPQSGSHYVYFESSFSIPPGYPGAGTIYPDAPNAKATMTTKEYSAFSSSRCLEFYYFINETISESSSADITFLGSLRVYQTSNNKISEILSVNQSMPFNWQRAQFQLEHQGEPFTITFYADAASHIGDKAIDSIRFYDMFCHEVDARKIPLPN